MAWWPHSSHWVVFTREWFKRHDGGLHSLTRQILDRLHPWRPPPPEEVEVPYIQYDSETQKQRPMISTAPLWTFGYNRVLDNLSNLLTAFTMKIFHTNLYDSVTFAGLLNIISLFWKWSKSDWRMAGGRGTTHSKDVRHNSYLRRESTLPAGTYHRNFFLQLVHIPLFLSLFLVAMLWNGCRFIFITSNL